MGRRYPAHPIPGVGAVLVRWGARGPQALLIQRGAPPGEGLWTVPGGAVEAGEGLREAARRECLEEVGLEVEPGPLLEVVPIVVRDDAGRAEYHYVIFDFLCCALGGALRVASDARDARWVGADELGALPLAGETGRVARLGLERLERLGRAPSSVWEMGRGEDLLPP